MLALGESKREAVLNGTADDKIFSVNTYKTYWKHIKYFLKYVKGQRKTEELREISYAILYLSILL